MTHETGDPILRLLAGLPRATPPSTLDERVRSRCYLALAAHNPPPQHHTRFATFAAGAANVTLAIAAIVYGAAVAIEALRLAGIL